MHAIDGTVHSIKREKVTPFSINKKWTHFISCILQRIYIEPWLTSYLSVCGPYPVLNLIPIILSLILWTLSCIPIIFVYILLHMCTCSILVTTTAKWKYLTVHNPHHFILYLSCQWLLASLPQWLLHWTDSLGRVGHVLLSLHRQSQSYSTVPSDQQIFFTFAKHLTLAAHARSRGLMKLKTYLGCAWNKHNLPQPG